MNKIIFTILLMAFCSYNLFAQKSVTKEEYAIYTVILKKIYQTQLKENKQKISFVIINETKVEADPSNKVDTGVVIELEPDVQKQLKQFYKLEQLVNKDF